MNQKFRSMLDNALLKLITGVCVLCTISVFILALSLYISRGLRAMTLFMCLYYGPHHYLAQY